MTPAQITASIAALQPAPAGESIQQCAVRIAHWLLGTFEDEHPLIAQTRALYGRVIAGDRPNDEEWQANIDASALARARALARALALARARARALSLALDLALARAARRILGDRVEPVQRLDTQILAYVRTPGHALDMVAYHSCDTTHCRAGTAIVLHPRGAELEFSLGSWLAGAVIYLASTGRVPDFFASSADAMADIERCAAA